MVGITDYISIAKMFLEKKKTIPYSDKTTKTVLSSLYIILCIIMFLVETMSFPISSRQMRVTTIIILYTIHIQ